MRTLQELDEEVEAILSANPNFGRKTIANTLGEHESRVRRSMARIAGGHKKAMQDFGLEASGPITSGLKREATKDAQSIEIHSDKIRTLEDLLDYAKTDREVWEVDKHVINSWDVGAKVKIDGVARILTQPLYQIKAWLKRKKNNEKAICKAIVDAIKEIPHTRIKTRGSPVRAGRLLEMSLFDVHLGKLCWGREVGTDYDSEIACALYLEAVEELLERSDRSEISEILLPIGNDMFNSDTEKGSTTAGTPQHEDGRWQRSYALGKKVLIQAIERLHEVAPVRVLTVPGNHDYQRSWYLGDVLQTRFERVKSITVDNAPGWRKYYHFGRNLIGFTHGNNEKPENLPLIMAQERPEDWAKADWREVHCGHWHHKKEYMFQPVLERVGVRVRFIPSLCPPDAWHSSKGYIAVRAAQSFEFDREGGLVSEHYFHPKIS